MKERVRGLKILLLWAWILTGGCRLFEGNFDTLVIGLHDAVGVVNPLNRGNRSSLAAQQLQLPALFEFIGRSDTEGRRQNRYRVGLVDTTRGAVNWTYKRRGGIFAMFRLRKVQWYDPRSGGSYAITGYDVKGTVERIKKVSAAVRLAHQRGRLRMDPFLNFVAEAIETIEVDHRNPQIVYFRFADHVLGPNRMHALTFRVLPDRLLNGLADDEDVVVTGTPYFWENWEENWAQSDHGRMKPPDAVLRFKARPNASAGTIGRIELETKQDPRSYKIQLESGAYGMAFGLPQRPGVDLDLPEHMAWEAYRSTDVWTFVFNCRRLEREDRRALLAVLSRPEGKEWLTGLVNQRYGEAGAELVRRSIFPNEVVDRYPRVREAIDRQIERIYMSAERARKRLAERRLHLIYGYGIGDQFEPDAIAQAIGETLAPFGVTLAEERLEYRELVAQLESGAGFDVALFKFSPAAQLPEDFDLGQMLPMQEERESEEGPYVVRPGPSNFFHFADAELFEAMLEFRNYPTENEYGEIDPDQLQKRQEALVKIDRIVREEAIGLFLFSPQYYWFWDDKYDIAFDQARIIGGEKLPTYGN